MPVHIDPDYVEPEEEQPLEGILMGGPLGGPLTSATIAQLVQSLIPLTWKHLTAASWYGAAMLTNRIEVAKYAKLPASLADADETTYSPLLKDYISKVAAFEILPAGIEYWMDQSIMRTSTGTNETVAYSDRVKALEDAMASLLKQITALEANPNLLPYITATTTDYADVSPADGTNFVTTDPQVMEIVYDRTTFGWGTELPPFTLGLL